jgi:hypothetical protein
MTRLIIVISHGTPSIHGQVPIENYRFSTARFDDAQNPFSEQTKLERSVNGHYRRK